jgi:predicted permease
VNLQRVDLGYPAEGLLTVRVDADAAGYAPPRQMAAFETLAARLRTVPGVRAATYSYNGLFGGTDNGDPITVEGYARGDAQEIGSSYDAVAPGYFSALAIPVLRGREVTNQDQAGGRMVCVINETFAKRFFAGRNPIGLHVTQQSADGRNTYEVVGVVRDSRQGQLRGEIESRFYTPMSRSAAHVSAVTFILQQESGRSALADVRQMFRRTEPNMPITRASTLMEAVDRRIVQDRMLAHLSIAFGVVAIVLAALGLYGILSYGIARRTNEIGIRKALGAQHGVLIAMIARETGWLVFAGLAIGGAVSVAAVRLISNRLYGLSSGDPVTFGTAVALLAVVAAIATSLPAWRTTRVDALVALRYE